MRISSIAWLPISLAFCSSVSGLTLEVWHHRVLQAPQRFALNLPGYARGLLPWLPRPLLRLTALPTFLLAATPNLQGSASPERRPVSPISPGPCSPSPPTAG